MSPCNGMIGKAFDRLRMLARTYILCVASS
jgi:hypothetical protein